MFALLLLVVKAQALTVMSINTEWLWDGIAPHEGQVALGAVGNPPSPNQVELEAFAIALVINHNNADIVGLVEVEGLPVVERILPYLNGDWKIVFKKGRDSYTGQDVALLTKLDIIDGTITNFPSTQGSFSNVTARPSKVLGVGLRDGNEDYFIIVAHLISKRSSNDNKRAAQANAVAQSAVSNASSYDHVIVMGDLNDTLESDTLNQLVTVGLHSVSGADDYSYEYKGNKELIDHILVTDGLKVGAEFDTLDLGPVSDHRAVKGVFD